MLTRNGADSAIAATSVQVSRRSPLRSTALPSAARGLASKPAASIAATRSAAVARPGRDGDVRRLGRQADARRDMTPGVAFSAFSRRATQAAQVMPGHVEQDFLARRLIAGGFHRRHEIGRPDLGRSLDARRHGG
ncbi:MAG: hypothetical protein V9G24_12010 [Rhodoblastus sp.]